MTINEAIWRDLSPFTIGFDNMFEQLSRVRQIPQTNYPPYNIRKGKSEDTFLIELAVAGFSEDDLTISVKENNQKYRIILNLSIPPHFPRGSAAWAQPYYQSAAL